MDADKYSVVLEECSSEPGRGRSGDAKEHYPPDWTQVDSAGPKPRRLQLLKRMSPIAVLKLRLGGDGPEVEQVTKVARPRCDNAMDGVQTVIHRKSGVFSKDNTIAILWVHAFSIPHPECKMDKQCPDAFRRSPR